MGEGGSPRKKFTFCRQESKPQTHKLNISQRKASYDGSHVNKKKSEERDISSARGVLQDTSLEEEDEVEMKYGFNYKNDILNGGGVGLDPN